MATKNSWPSPNCPVCGSLVCTSLACTEQTHPQPADDAHLWAYGRADVRNPFLKWVVIVERAQQLGGRMLVNGLVFPDTESKQQFDIWYADNAAAGLRVRSRVSPPTMLNSQQFGRLNLRNLIQPPSLNTELPTERRKCHACGEPLLPAQGCPYCSLEAATARINAEPNPLAGGQLGKPLEEQLARCKAAVEWEQRKEPSVVTAPAPAVAPQFSTLKELRMWHWRQVLQYLEAANRFEREVANARRPDLARRYQKEVDNWHIQANLHLSAVQVLNDSVPGTAEQDCAEADK